ncbi:MAG: hypothetical protein HY819_21540 [Acidobacteria bacterium]|nr:hypothetical protein [Acidobacteriota bacterium]
MSRRNIKALAKTLRKFFRKTKKQVGAALAIVSLILLVLTILIISAHYTTIVQTTSSANYRDTSQAFYVAEAGVQRSIDWFTHRYSQDNLQPSPSSPPDWPNIAGTNNIPTGINGQGDRIYPNKMTNNSLVILTNDSSGATVATFPTVTKTGGTLNGTSVNVAADFQNYLNATNDFESTATNSVSGKLKGRYIVTATLLSTKLISSLTGQSQRVERWRISSIGTWANFANTATNPGVELARAENIAIIETLTKSNLSHAICANGFNFNGSTTVDSYDSSLGPYSTTNSGGATAIGAFETTTSGTFDRGNQTLPGGQFDVPTPPTTFGFNGCGMPGVNCGTNFCPAVPPIPTANFVNFGTGTLPTDTGLGLPPIYLAIPTPSACNPTCPTAPTLATCTACARDINLGGGINKTITIAGISGDFSFWVKNIQNGSGGSGDLIIDNLTPRIVGSIIPIANQGTLNIYVDSISTNNRNIIVMSDINNPVNIYVKTAFDFGGNANFNSSTNPGGVKVFYTGSTSLDISASGNPAISCILVAPNAQVTNSGSSAFYGAIVANNFRRNGGGSATQQAGVHFDRQLANEFSTIFSFVPQTQVRRVF